MAATDAASVPQATPLRKTASKVVPRPMFISWLALAFMTTSSVASLRAAPSMAVFGLVSPQMGFLAVWCQFALTITYYPSLRTSRARLRIGVTRGLDRLLD
ncbi:MAG: hypothetical protein ACJ757_01365 [Gaiellaceae bacterium]